MNLKSSFLLIALGIMPVVANPVSALANEADYTEAYVVTGSHFERPLNQIGSDVTVITEEDFKKYNATSVSDALRQSTNVIVMQNANGLSNVYLRGGKSDYTLVLLDGIPVNDTTQPSFDFSTINLNNVDRIEIVQGAQAAIYGANALSGVINIITKKGSGELNGTARIQGGTPEQYMASIQANAGTDKYSWTLAGTYSYANQISSYSELQNGKGEKDPNSVGSISASATITPTDFFKVTGIFRYDHQELDIDGTDFYWTPVDDSSKSSVKRTFFSLSPSLIHLDGLWTQTLNMSYIDSKRNAQYVSQNSESNYDSESVRIDWNHKLDFDWQQVAFGVTYTKDKAVNFESWYAIPDQKTELENVALYLEYTANPLENLYITAAGRVDNYQSYASKFSGSLSAAYTIEQTGTQLRASVGNAFKMLSLEQLTVNPELDPTDAFTWDIGVTQALFDDKLELSATYYNARYSNIIDSDYNWPIPNYYSIGATTAHGIELGLIAKPIKDLRIAAFATFADTNVEKTGKEQGKQANSIYRVDIDYVLPYEWYATYSIGASYKYVGERLDYNPATFASDFVAPSYNLVDLRFKAALDNGLNFYLNLNNLFNEDYEEVTGYESLGFNANFAVEYNF